MAWKTKYDMMFDEEEADTVRGIKNGSNDSGLRRYGLFNLH